MWTVCEVHIGDSLAVSLLVGVERPVDSFAVSLSDCYLELLRILFVNRETIMPCGQYVSTGESIVGSLAVSLFVDLKQIQITICRSGQQIAERSAVKRDKYLST